MVGIDEHVSVRADVVSVIHPALDSLVCSLRAPRAAAAPSRRACGPCSRARRRNPGDQFRPGDPHPAGVHDIRPAAVVIGGPAVGLRWKSTSIRHRSAPSSRPCTGARFCLPAACGWKTYPYWSVWIQSPSLESFVVEEAVVVVIRADVGADLDVRGMEPDRRENGGGPQRHHCQRDAGGDKETRLGPRQRKDGSLHKGFIN